jgi:molybdopterin-guanine dinucleotide biosynthesis protein
MKLVVVGGHSRNIGKTSVMAGLIRSLESLGWTAVKITQYGHGIGSQDGEPCGCEPAEHPFELTEEKDPGGHGDTCRFLRAGAKRSLWLRVRQGQLETALPALLEAISRDNFVIIESNSILGLVQPDLYLVVLDNSRRDFKPSARQFLERADALVPIASGSAGSGLDARAWPALDPAIFRDKPVFPVREGKYFNPELSEFVRRKLALPDPQPASVNSQ